MSRFGFGFNQKSSFNGTRQVSTATVYMGAMRGKGSTTRKFNYCKTHSPAPWQCIDQFVNIQGTNPPVPPVTSNWSTVPGQDYFTFSTDFSKFVFFQNASGVVDQYGNLYVTVPITIIIDQDLIPQSLIALYNKENNFWQYQQYSLNSDLLQDPNNCYVKMIEHNKFIYCTGNFFSIVIKGTSNIVPMNGFGVYDISNNTWDTLNPNNQYLTNLVTSFALYNNIIYFAVSGPNFTGNQGYLTTYDINTNTWGRLGSIAANFNLNGMAIDSKGFIYIIGNDTQPTNLGVIFQIANGQTSALGSGYFVGTLNCINIDKNNNIYVGGNFIQYNDVTSVSVSMNYAARWNGTSWVPLTTNNQNALNGSVKTMTSDVNNTLFIGGSFTGTTNGTTLNNVASWNLNNPVFSPLIYGLNNTLVNGLFTGNDSLYVLGNFDGFYNSLNPQSLTPCTYMTTWTNSPTPPPPPPVTSWWQTIPGQGFALTGKPGYSGVVDNKGNIYVSNLNKMSIYNNTTQTWQNILINSQSGIKTAYLLSNNNIVYIGGNFTDLSGSVSLTSNYFASYNTSTNTWTNLNASNYITSPITAFTVKNNIIFMATEGGNQIITCDISVNPPVFDKIGSILDTRDIINNIALDSQNNIYMSGQFYETGDTNRILILTKEQIGWSPQWANVGGWFDAIIKTIAIDSNNNVYIGGNFTQVTNGVNPPITTPYIAQWNGTTWSALQSSNGDLIDGVNSIVIDSTSNLYIGGAINTTATTLNNIAKWSPSNPAFNPLQNGLNKAVNYLFTDNSNLYVLGAFTGYYNNLNPPSVTTCQFMTTWTNI